MREKRANLRLGEEETASCPERKSTVDGVRGEEEGCRVRKGISRKSSKGTQPNKKKPGTHSGGKVGSKVGSQDKNSLLYWTELVIRGEKRTVKQEERNFCEGIPGVCRPGENKVRTLPRWRNSSVTEDKDF